MDNYKVVRVGGRYQVVEERPDGLTSSVDGFPTEHDARGWLDGFLILLGLIDCMGGKTPMQ
jgi:hypothetical protein